MSSLAAGVTLVQDPGGREAVRLVGKGGSVLIATLGAQVLSWQSPLGEVLWWGSKAEYAPGKPVRGGIPLVFPWFGDHPTDKSQPAHGFARNLVWRVESSGSGPEVTLVATDDAATRAMWPHAFSLRLSVALTDTLRIALTIGNPGAREFTCEEALHTYFALGDVRLATVHGLEGVACTEHAAAPEGPWDQQAPLQFRAETDRIFQGTKDRIELRAPALRRAITLQTTNARSAIVWNPWPAKTARLSGMAADDWTRFCCIESANVRANTIAVAPGQSHTLSLVLSSRAV